MKISILPSIKRKAQAIFTTAVRDGMIKRKPCVICGNPKTHGHHENYGEPLNVIWLCNFHHRKHHIDMLNHAKQRTDRIKSIYKSMYITNHYILPIHGFHF